MADREFNYSIVMEVVNQTQGAFSELSTNIANLSNSIKGMSTNTGANAKASDEANSSMSTWQKTATTFATTMADVVAGIGIGIKVFTELGLKMGEDELAMSRLENTIKMQGQNWFDYKEKMSAVVNEIIRTTRYTDDDLIPALNKLTMMTGESGKALDLMQIAVNMASSGMFDLDTAIRLLGQAQEGNFGILGRYIPQIKSMVEEYGFLYDKTDLVQKVTETLRTTFDGMSKNEATTLWGKMTDLVGAMGETIEKLSENTGLNYLLKVWADGMSTIVGWINQLLDLLPQQNTSVTDLIDQTGKLKTAVDSNSSAMNSNALAVQSATSKYDVFGGTAGTAKIAIDGTNAVVKEGTNAFGGFSNATDVLNGKVSGLATSTTGLGTAFSGTLASMGLGWNTFISQFDEGNSKLLRLFPALDVVMQPFNKSITNFNTTMKELDINTSMQKIGAGVSKMSFEVVKSLDDLVQAIEDEFEGIWADILIFAVKYGTALKRIMDSVTNVFQNAEDLMYMEREKNNKKEQQQAQDNYDVLSTQAEQNYLAEKDRILTQVADEDERNKQLAIAENNYNTTKLKNETDYEAKQEALKDQMEQEDRNRRERMKPILKAQALMNSAVAVTQVWAEPLPFWSKLALSALMTIELLQQVAIIDAQQFAKGGRNIMGGLALVGEQGAELVELPQGSNVFTHNQSMQMAGAGAGAGGMQFNFNINGNYIMNDSNARSLADIVSTVIVNRIKKENLI